jgi:UDP-3-O-[3-hydroxymyristoyl] glucosamine N-acyltransferase
MDLNNYAFEKYHTYIRPTSSISTAAYIKDNCNIADKAIIKENVYLNNCEIGQNVIINSNSVIDAQHTKIQNNCILSQNTSIMGKLYITIKPSPDILEPSIDDGTLQEKITDGASVD